MIQGLENLEAKQQPTWPDVDAAQAAIGVLEAANPLVTVRDTDLLTQQLAKVQRGEAFLLQGGPCAERFTDRSERVKSLLNAILPMNMVLGYGAGVPVVKVGRIAGQYGKPRSSDTETQDNITLPSFRGDIVNRPEFSIEAREHNPWNMVTAYEHAKTTLETLHELTKGGYADIERMHDWNIEFAKNSAQGPRYERIAHGISRALRFMRAAGINGEYLRELHEARVFTSHEALVLDYEKALTRETEDGLYDTSAHMLWAGERTRDTDGAHIAFLGRVRNPKGVKIGPTVTPGEILELCEALNSEQVPGRLVLISRMGKDAIKDVLPPIIEAVEAEGHPVVYEADPMHGQTVTAESGHKTRNFDDIMEEVNGFFDVCEEQGVWPGGLHLEMTGDNVTECLGGSAPNEVTNLNINYDTACDPRLNADQSIELAFQVAERLEQNQLTKIN